MQTKLSFAKTAKKKGDKKTEYLTGNLFQAKKMRLF